MRAWRTWRTWTGVIAVAIVASACGGDPGGPAGGGQADEAPSSFETPFAGDKAYPVFVSSELSVGPNRFLVGLLNDQDAPIGSPRTEMDITFFDLERSDRDPESRARMEWFWVDKPFVGLYAGEVRFDRAGNWGAEVTISGPGLEETVRSSFEVSADPATPAIGERVPASETPTAGTARDIRTISTDDDPEARFYETSVAEAVRSGEAFVLVFATPKFCVSATCGPMLDVVNGVARDFPKLTFIHVEPYELPADPAALEVVDSVREWNLPNEPWTFVVDSRGRLAAKFEGAVSPPELGAMLRRLR